MIVLRILGVIVFVWLAGMAGFLVAQPFPVTVGWIVAGVVWLALLAGAWWFLRQRRLRSGRPG